MPKKSPLVLRMIVLVFAMVCGVYICSICLKQVSTRNKTGYLDLEVIERPCPEPSIELEEVPYVHYPKPETYSRYNAGYIWFQLWFCFHLECNDMIVVVLLGLNAHAILSGTLQFCRCRGLGVGGLRHY